MKLKRILAFLLIVAMGLTMLPSQAQAAESPQPNLDNSNMAITGTNGFGDLLSAEFVRSQEEAAADGQSSYAVTDLQFSGATATVTYSASEEAILLVAVYTEDGLQMLASGKTTVSPQQTQATVTIQGTMPQYFYAGAFLMDPDDYTPLCEDYSTPMYTREMQELLASTVDDYAPERVYNLDNDKTTNFAIFAEDTIVVSEQASVNTVVSADHDNRIYVIQNADATVTSLQKGDVLAYPYGDDNILIVKVDTITLNGTTATITGGDLEMEEAFAAVKIETKSSDFEVDPTTAGEGITYLGDGQQARSADPSIGAERSAAFEVKLVDNKGIEVTGTVTLGIASNVTWYTTQSYQKLELTFDLFQKYTFAATGKFQLKDHLPISNFELHPVAGLSIALVPKLMLEFSGAITTEYTCTSGIGAFIEYDGKAWDANVYYKTPAKAFDAKLEGSVFFGVSLAPTVEVLEGLLATVKIEGKLGVELKGTESIGGWAQDPDSLHNCTSCIDGDLCFVYSVEPSITLLNSEHLTLKAKWVDVKIKYLDFYWSKDLGEFHLGTCPNISYRVTVGVFDANYSPISGAAVYVDTDTFLTTNQNGLATIYLPNGNYRVSTELNNNTLSASFSVADKSQKILLGAALSAPEIGLPGDVSSETFTDYGAVMDFGDCGDNIVWFLKEDGSLYLTGSGAMKDYYSVNQPWVDSRSAITSVHVSEGITKIGNSAFAQCANLKEADLPSTVQTIGNNAFSSCSKLVSIHLPDGITCIDDRTFSLCSSLKTVTFPDSLTEIGMEAFYSCKALTGVSFPKGLTRIEEEAFYDCDGLKELNLPDGITYIGPNAFACCEGFQTVVIPDSITVLENSVFAFCYYLKSITIPNSVTSIGEMAFKWDLRLTSITIPESVTNIGKDAFYYCKYMTKVTFRGDAPTISNSQVFYDVTATVYYPADNPTWTSDVMGSYGGKLTWKPYTLDGSGNMVIQEAAAVTFYPEEAAEAEEPVPAFTEEEAPILPTSFTDDLLIPEQPTGDVSPDAVYGGEYSTEDLGIYTLKTATFSGLVPGEEYVMLALVGIDTADVFAADNLLGILQGTAASDGTLKFQYVQRVDADISYVVACGASSKNLKDAAVTFPQMFADGTLQAVNPTITYNGKPLVEGQDYRISGTVSFTEPGTYTCQIKGIHNYAGTVTCTYTVEEAPVLLGDVNDDEVVNTTDAYYVLLCYREQISLDAEQRRAADVDGNGRVDTADVYWITLYVNGRITAFPKQ